MTLTKSTFKPAEDSSFPWTRRVPFNTLLKFPTPKPIKRGGLIRLEEIGWGGEEGGAAKLPLKQSFKVGPCKTCDKYPHQDMSSSLHIWASPKHDADKSSDFCKQFIKRPSGVDHRRAVPQMSLLLRIWTNACFYTSILFSLCLPMKQHIQSNYYQK